MAASVLTAFSPRLARLSSTELPDRIAGARDLWQRRLIELQHGGAVADELPAAILRPESADDVVEIVATARREGAPFAPILA